MSALPPYSGENPVEVTHLYRSYNGIQALNDLSFKLKKNEILGLLGPNGAGKTTAIHILLGLLSPTSGNVSVLGWSPLKDRTKISRYINFSSAYVQLPTNLKVIENLKTFARLYNISRPKEKIDFLLETFEMTNLTNRLVGVLSSGERTRLNLCKCFLNDPTVLLLDEPTASLDPEMANTVRHILKKMQAQRKMSVLYTSHNMYEVEEMCDRILFLNKGQIIAEGTHKDFLKKFGGRTLEEVFIKIVRGNIE